MPEDEQPHEQAVERLERQLVRGGLYTHTELSHNATRLHEAEAFLYGLVDVLIEKGLLIEKDVLSAVKNVREQMTERGQTLDPNIALRVDGDSVGPDDFQPVNCAERIHICKAVCCKLNFALSAPEVEAGVVKWDLGAPYFIRHEASGSCTHLSGDHGCSVYADRPSICRRYSCANDERIWSDFPNMVLNDAWIEENLGPERLSLVAQQMLPQVLTEPSRPESSPRSD
jgi:Fe-S-cluster containining protein